MEKWHFDGHGVNDEHGRRIAKVSLLRETPNQHGLEPEFEECSHLIAAAPDLLEALEIAHNCLQVLSDHHKTDYRNSLTAETIQYALLKAKGKE